MRILIVDPGVHSRGGHHYNAVQRLQRELAALELAAPCLGSAYADAEVVRDLVCTPTFTRSVYGRSYEDPREFADSVDEASRNLAQALVRHGRNADLLVLPCCDQVLAASIARAFGRTRFRSPPHVLLWLLYGPHYLLSTDDPRAVALAIECRDAFAALRASLGNAAHLHAYAETRQMAEFYKPLIGLEVGVMPAPGLLMPARGARRQAPDRPPTVLCIGFANRPKGYRLLPEAIGQVLQRHGTARFLIHGIVKGSDAEGDQPVFDRLSALGERVRVRQDVLSDQDYAGLLNQADLLLMPYDPAVYHTRGSGVFSDARKIGLPVVATGACAFARPAFEQGWGVAITEYGPPGVATAVLTALERLDGLARRAAAVAEPRPDELRSLLQSVVSGIRAERQPGLAGFMRRLSALRL
ncbi:glycosyltransferase family 4 protein [Reyranella sp.]|uniref:glycosyltransferase family 4 protein n=2 Tax=Reyranella sp. TaxID=1929291 RepID=UPI003D0BDAE8